MTEELLDAVMTCPHKAAMLAAGWTRREIEIGKMTRRHIDAGANSILLNPDDFEVTLRATTAAFEHEATRRPYMGLPPEADLFKVYDGQIALLKAALYAVNATFGSSVKATFCNYIPPPDAIVVIRSHGTWTEQQRRDLRFNLHLQGMMVKAQAAQASPDAPGPPAITRLLYQPLVIGHRGPDGQDSPLTRFWINTMTGQKAWCYEWTDVAGRHRLGSDWKKVYIHLWPNIKASLCAEELRACQPQAGDPFRLIFPPAVEVRYEPALAEVWHRMSAGQWNERIHWHDAGTRNANKHWNQCATLGDRCPFIEHCWDGDDHHLVKLKDLLGGREGSANFAETLKPSAKLADMEE